MLQNTMVTAFTVSEFIKPNKAGLFEGGFVFFFFFGGGGVQFKPTPLPPFIFQDEHI